MEGLFGENLLFEVALIVVLIVVVGLRVFPSWFPKQEGEGSTVAINELALSLGRAKVENDQLIRQIKEKDRTILDLERDGNRHRITIANLEAKLIANGIEVEKTIKINPLAEIREIIDQSFSRTELKEFAFDLQIDYREWATDDSWAILILNAAKREGKFEALLGKMKRSRPDLDFGTP